jgi:CTP:molybdopterin cytidylyltransferase MocA
VRVAGLLLAAGAGRRMGRPKALLRAGDGTSFLARGVGSLLDGGCGPVTVVLGAEADAARDVLGTSWQAAVSVVVAEDWAEGMGASLRAGLASMDGAPADAVVVTLVDLPDVGGDVVRRVVAAGTGPHALVRAEYDGRPGHPVLLGREHWTGVAAAARGDQGAREYFRAHPPTACECGDLATGRDVDRPEDLPR